MKGTFVETPTRVCNRLTKSAFSHKAKYLGLLGTVSYKSQRNIQNLIKHLRFGVLLHLLLKAFNYFCKALHL